MATSRSRLSLSLLYGTLPSRRSCAYSRPEVDGAEPLSGKEDPLLGDVLGEEEGNGRATSTASAKRSAVVRLFSQQLCNTNMTFAQQYRSTPRTGGGGGKAEAYWPIARLSRSTAAAKAVGYQNVRG